MKPVMTYELAMAASRDAGNRNMRKHGRTRWNLDDWNVACAEFERIFPVSQGIACVPRAAENAPETCGCIHGSVS